MVAPPSKCSKELANAVYDDFKRKAVDAAKKRAVAQNVDYETFKNMVSVAHLRPLQAPNLQAQGSLAPSWSFAPDGTRVQLGQAEAVAASAALLSETVPTQPPSTSGDFARDWRRSCPTPELKYQYLRLCGPDHLRTLFRVEISADVLRDVLGVLSTCWLSQAGAQEELGVAEGGAVRTALWVSQVLEALSSTGRFNLSLKLLGAAGKQVVASLISQLQEACDACAAAVSQEVNRSCEDTGHAEPPTPAQDADTAQGTAGQQSVQLVAQELSAGLQRVRAAYGLE